MDRKQRNELLEKLLSERILVLDGAMGTSIQQLDLTADDYGGTEYEGCPENLIITRPDVLVTIHEGFLKAGADIVETNTFGGTPMVLDEYTLGKKAYEINRDGAILARRAADNYSTIEKPRFVAGSMGPTTRALTVTGGTTFDRLVEDFYIQAKGLYDGGSDYLLLETAQDTLNIKAGLYAIHKLNSEVSVPIPVAVSITIEPTGTMLGGQVIEAAFTALGHNKLLSFGMNCATGPDKMRDPLRTVNELAYRRLSCVPNAGLPDEDGHYHLSPQALADTLGDYCSKGWLNLVGGCCGTTTEHIHALDKMVRDKRPHITLAGPVSSQLSGIDWLEVTDEKRPLLVGERTNVIGSRAFKNMIIDGRWEEASELARRQVKAGASIIDVCMSNPDRDEYEDMQKFLPMVIQKTRAPLMIDSTDARVMELGLKWSQGKSVLNSINLEDGEERFEAVVPLAQEYGAALVVGCIDEDKEQGMGVSVERKLEIARRSYQILRDKYDYPEEDIYFDPLVFPCGTGDEQYIGSAEQTIEGVRAIKEAFPKCKTVLGISNVSFGLPAAGREVLNSVFLYHCVKAGLDLAIVNSEKLERYPAIPENERKLAEDLIFHTADTYDAVLAAFAGHFKTATGRAGKDKSKELPLDERLSAYIIDGSKDGLVDDLELKRKEAAPLAIINGPLMAGMNEVGRLFNNNELIVAEVLQSAEAMKAAVSHLEQFMEAEDVQSEKARVLLATVKGDVHDIGKNLVDIILSNNGYKVINLGIKILPEQIIQEARDHKVDIIGLSGLLVKSAQQMVLTAEDMKKAGLDTPVIVGGAALTERFVRNRIRPAAGGSVFYARDAMSGLRLINTYMNEESRPAMIEEWDQPAVEEEGSARAVNEGREKLVLKYDYGITRPSDLELHEFSGVDTLHEIYSYVNPGMLFKKHMGYKGTFSKNLAEGEEKAVKLKQQMDDFLEEVVRDKLIEPRAVYRFFPACSTEDNEVIVFNEDRSAELGRFTFGRQEAGWQLSAADFVAPRDSGYEDHIGLFVVSCGSGVRELYEKYNAAGEYLRSHMLQSLAIEMAEGYAEIIHSRMRSEWGIADQGLTVKDLFQTKYTGIRLSFGYPACPELEQQQTLFKLLPADKIGVELTEEYMMEPEASVSALVFAHPEGRYFSL